MKNIKSILGSILLLISQSLEKRPYIFGGEKAKRADFQYQAAIVIRQLPYGEWLKGGGTIIAPHFVVTATSVLIYISRILFENDLVYVYANSNKWRKGKAYPISHVYKHPFFNELTYDNDIAIIRVAIPFWGKHEKSIKIAGNSYYTKEGDSVLISGWGTKTYYPIKIEENLQKLNVNLINLEECKEIYNKFGFLRRVTSRTMCSLKPGKGSCEGDGGGPVVHNGVLVGVISWNRKCGDEIYPSVYTEISSHAEFIGWIEERFQVHFNKAFRF